MKKFIVIQMLCISIISTAWSNKTNNFNWKGVWEYQRYTTNVSGILKIDNCKENQCHFNINTSNGAHTCDIKGKLKIQGNKAVYKNKEPIGENEYEDVIINFEANTDKNIITVNANRFSHIYCGIQGYFEGEYENENNPFRDDTGFNCRTTDLTDVEKVICASEKLAQADKELSENYKFIQTKEWYNKRATCHNNKNCLWNFYVSSIKFGYEQKHKKPLNLYEYMGNLGEDSLYYPTDFTLLNDYLIKNTDKEDYKKWTLNFSQVSLDHNKCEQCQYRQYGLAGLYTLRESAFYINKDEIWLAFLDIEDTQNKYIIVYSPSNKEEKDIPPAFNNWLNRLKPYFPKGIKLKHFSAVMSE